MSTTKLARLAAKLDRETVTGKLAWYTEPPPSDLVRGTNNIINQVFETDYNGIRLRVFEKRTKAFVDDVTYYWESSFVLQFVGDSGSTDWEAENVSGLADLVETIRFKTSKVEQKIDAILAA